jgi:uncharacterized surface protein with fasciclin (FAS1) repeats
VGFREGALSSTILAVTIYRHMDNQSNIFGWVVGAIVVVLIIAGIWWFVQANPAANTNGNATTTPQVATTTTGTTGTPVATATEVRTSSTVNAVVASLAGSSRFASLYSSTGVSASVTGKGPYTVFVPTDAAFANLTDAISTMTAAEKKRLVQYAVVSGKMLDIDAVNSGTHTALSKDPLNFQVQPQTKLAYVNSGYTITQYKASNGIVYVISAVLVPPQTPDSQTGSTGTITP